MLRSTIARDNYDDHWFMYLRLAEDKVTAQEIVESLNNIQGRY